MNTLYNPNYLFKRIAEGDEGAFREVFHTYNARLYPFILKVVHSESVAEDIIQDTYLRLWTHREEVAQMEHPVSWLFKVASNLSLSLLRSQAAEIRRLQRMKTTAGDTTEQAIIDSLSVKELQLLITKAIDQLPPKRQEIYRLSREQGLNYKEIAERLQLSPNTIRNQLVSALKFIRDYIRRTSGIIIPFLILFFLA